MAFVMGRARTEQERRIAANLEKFRKEWGISQAKAGQLVGVPANTWITWEKTGRTPTGANLIRIAAALERTVDELAAENPPPPRHARPPGFGLYVISDDASPQLVSRAWAMLRELNESYRREIGSPKKHDPIITGMTRLDDAEKARREIAVVEGEAPAAKPKRVRIPPRRK